MVPVPRSYELTLYLTFNLLPHGYVPPDRAPAAAEGDGFCLRTVPIPIVLV